MNCCIEGMPRVTLPGVKLIEVSAACVGDGPTVLTVSLPVAVRPLVDAVTLTVPGAIPIAKPGFDWPDVSIVTSFAFDDAQVTVPVRSLVEPSLYLPVAVNCNSSPTPVEEDEGFRLMLRKVGDFVLLGSPV